MLKRKFDAYNDEADCLAEDSSDHIEIENLQNGKFCNKYPVASAYFPFIIGKQGATKRRIESETYTQIKIPGRGQKGDIVIIGKDIRTTRTARLKLELLLEQARGKYAPTHFLSLPVAVDTIKDTFKNFKSSILETCGSSRGVDETIFQTAERLHLTMTVIVLADERERSEAIHIMKQCANTVVKDHCSSQGLKVRIKGVDYMNDDPGEVHVLYAKVTDTDWSDSLQKFADALVQVFIKAGLVAKRNEKVKLHITLMNTKLRDKEEDFMDEEDGQSSSALERRSDQKFNKRESFDARDILETYGDFDFGEVQLQELHLSMMHTKGSDGFYVSSAKLPLTS